MSRPSPIAQVTKGKVIDITKNFVKTFNWMAKFLCNLKFRNGLALNEDSEDDPHVGLEGFEEATDGYVPSKSGDSIGWIDVGSLSSGVVKSISVVSKSDSNVFATVSGPDDDGHVVIELGVYYK